MIPLQLVDSFLLNYNIGQALLLVFVLATLGALPLKSPRIIALNCTVFGLVFLLTPQSLAPLHYVFLGIVLVVVGPILWVASEE